MVIGGYMNTLYAAAVGAMIAAFILSAVGCGARVGNAFVIGTPSIHQLDNDRLKILGVSGQGS